MINRRSSWRRRRLPGCPCQLTSSRHAARPCCGLSLIAGGGHGPFSPVSGGMAPPGNVADITPALVQEAVTTKVVGHVLLAQALLPLMRQQATSSWTVITGMLGEHV